MRILLRRFKVKFIDDLTECIIDKSKKTLVTCLSADSGVASWIASRSHTFVEIDHEIISMPFR